MRLVDKFLFVVQLCLGIFTILVGLYTIISFETIYQPNNIMGGWVMFLIGVGVIAETMVNGNRANQ